MSHNTETANLEFTHIFKTKVTYSVSVSKENDLLTVPETFIINGKYMCLIVLSFLLFALILCFIHYLNYAKVLIF